MVYTFRVIIYLVTIFFIFSCNSKQNRHPLLIPNDNTKEYSIDSGAKLTFKNKTIDFGNISADTLLTAKYKFFNTGENDVVIYYVNPDCSCTNYYLSNDTILPGDSAFIILEFSTANRFGQQKIYATVCANTFDKFYKLTLKTNILR